MKHLTKKQIIRAAKKLKVNLKVVSLDTLSTGIKVELEHGKISPKTNITDNSIIKTLKIALAHLQEYPNYYVELKRMEKKLEKKWKNKTKPNIYI